MRRSTPGRGRSSVCFATRQRNDASSLRSGHGSSIAPRAAAALRTCTGAGAQNRLRSPTASSAEIENTSPSSHRSKPSSDASAELRLQPLLRMRVENALVVHPQELDHVAHVVLRLYRPRGRPRGIGEHRVRLDPTLLPKLLPDALRKAEVRGAVAVQVTDLAATQLEGELAAPPRPGLHAGPGRDLVGDLGARGRLRRHAGILSRDSFTDSASSLRTRAISSLWAASSAGDAPRSSSSARTCTRPFSCRTRSLESGSRTAVLMPLPPSRGPRPGSARARARPASTRA